MVIWTTVFRFTVSIVEEHGVKKYVAVFGFLLGMAASLHNWVYL